MRKSTSQHLADLIGYVKWSVQPLLFRGHYSMISGLGMTSSEVRCFEEPALSHLSLRGFRLGSRGTSCTSSRLNRCVVFSITFRCPRSLRDASIEGFRLWLLPNLLRHGDFRMPYPCLVKTYPMDTYPSSNPTLPQLSTSANDVVAQVLSLW